MKLMCATIFVAITGAGLGTGVALHHDERVEVTPTAAFTVRAGADTDVTIDVRNRHPWKRVTIVDVATTCGCLEPRSFPRTIPPRSVGTVHFTAHPDPRVDETTQRVEIMLASRSVLASHVTTVVRPPFEGYPDAAIAMRTNDGLRIDLDRRYLGVVDEVVALDAAEREMAVDLVDEASCVVIHGDDAETLILSVDDGSMGWAGPIEIEE